MSTSRNSDSRYRKLATAPPRGHKKNTNCTCLCRIAVHPLIHDLVRSLQNAFLVWLNSSSYWTKDTPFFTDRPHPDSPALIVAWIMSRCDSKDAQGRVIPTAQIRQSYSYAQKMRAAMTHAFGHNHGLGKAKWHKDDRGIWKGNPSVSDTVSGYLVNLRRTKTRSGEGSTTAKAIRHETLKKIYDFNQAENRSVPTPYVPGRRNHNDAWGSPRVRLQTYALMLICFWCLLRSDEAVRITFDDLEFIPADATTPSSFELTLRWRKTDQFGQVKPFRLYMRDECEAHLCPVRAIAAWISSAQKESGPLFRKMNSGDLVSDEPLASDTFLEWFRNCLFDVDDPFPSGTHAFRRAGCQHLSSYLPWGGRHIADWGGWSTFATFPIRMMLAGTSEMPSGAGHGAGEGLQNVGKDIEQVQFCKGDGEDENHPKGSNDDDTAEMIEEVAEDEGD
ncbi:hypothetical protein R3P38DRAFT_2555618 [Favolaschia claudopus]|uniref:Tyr recombinase domain-containing protein n=1 Tax=Favolaschia claudopus TaxID=2862362 RepID=A0AAW0ABA9_9AGAR